MPTPFIPQRPLEKAYDYIVVGGGSGGCAVARRLIDGCDATVLVIEAGEPGIDVAEIDDPAAWVPLGRSRYDWGYDYAPTPRINGRTIGIPRGKVLGGSSAINAMMWYRGHPMDYDAWQAAGCDGWSFKDVLPYFKRCEDWEGGETEFRGAGGPLRIERPADLHPVAEAMLGGSADLGIPVIDDPNGESNEGATPANFNISAGKRWSSAKGYLHPILNNNRLTVLTGSLAIGLTVENGRATAVRHLVDAIEPVENGEARRGGGFEFDEDIVLDDHQIMGGRGAQQSMRGLGRHGRARRIVQCGIGDVEPRPICVQRRFECGDIRARPHMGDADDLDPMRAKQRLEIEVTGIVDQHRIAGMQQVAADQIDRLGAGSGQEQLVRASFDAFVGEAAEEEAAQLQRSARAAIVAQYGGIGAGEFA